MNRRVRSEYANYSGSRSRRNQKDCTDLKPYGQCGFTKQSAGLYEQKDRGGHDTKTAYRNCLLEHCHSRRCACPGSREGRWSRLSGATPFLQYIAYPLEMMEQVVRLHLDDKPDRHSFMLSVPLAECDGTIPRWRHGLQELKDVFPGGLKEGQRCIKGSRAICPPICPRPLRHLLVPTKCKLGMLIAQRHLDAQLPDIIAIRYVMYDLPDRPAAF
jgi:hypothetical protein